MPSPLARRNRRVALILACVVAGMTGLSFASVPLYRLFCAVTGFGGTTQRAEAAPHATLERTMKVEFNADVSAELGWEFAPAQRSVTVKVGEERLVSYHAKNKAEKAVTGVALYNVTPEKAGIYFMKTACFCFDEQKLEPGERKDFPVSFYIDPAIADDPNMADVTSITLSYAFFRAKSQALEDAKAKGYQE